MSPNNPPDPCQEPPVHINLVAAAHGLDAGGYTFPYVATWAGGDLMKVRQSAEAVTAAVRAILSCLRGALGEQADRPAVRDSAA